MATLVLELTEELMERIEAAARACGEDAAILAANTLEGAFTATVSLPPANQSLRDSIVEVLTPFWAAERGVVR